MNQLVSVSSKVIMGHIISSHSHSIKGTSALNQSKAANKSNTFTHLVQHIFKDILTFSIKHIAIVKDTC